MKHREGFGEVPDHVGFSAKKLFGSCGEIADGSIAYIEPGGGGPVESHMHRHSHLFIVTKGCVKIVFEMGERMVQENESFLVDGGNLHSMWNVGEEEACVIGISINVK